jgi:polyisoprenoid-binding protein YceI
MIGSVRLRNWALRAGVLMATMGLAKAPAQAVEYQRVLAEQSSIAFSYQQMGVQMEGQFKRFAARMSFDPSNPESAQVTVDVAVTGIDAGSSVADQEVLGKPWFNATAFPTASFRSSSVKALGGNRYQVTGKLTIKGQARDVVVPATFSTQGDTDVFEGQFTIRRGDFNIGEGPWAPFDIVENEVQVRFQITSTPNYPPTGATP